MNATRFSIWKTSRGWLMKLAAIGLAVGVTSGVLAQEGASDSWAGAATGDQAVATASHKPHRLPEGVEIPKGDGHGGPRQCGPVVYQNAYNGSGYYQPTGAGMRVADDCALVNFERGVCEVYSDLYNAGSAGNTITLELWDGCPQGGGSLLAVSPPFTLVSGFQRVYWTVDPVLPIGNTVWVAWTSPQGNVLGPLISEQAEWGYTEDRFGTDDCAGGGPSCRCYYGGNPWAGLDVTISAVEVPSACCEPDDTCLDLFESDCLAAGGDWYVGAYCETFMCPPECPPDTLYGQEVVVPSDFWAAYTSDQTPGYLVYDNFSGLTESICDIRFWGTQGYWDNGWANCSEDPMTFEIKFYQDAGGQPGTLACSYTVTLNGTYTGLVYHGSIDWPLYEYNTALIPCCTLADGWISIQAVGGDPSCWFLWMNGYGPGDGAYQWDGVSLNAIPADMAFCLTGASLELVPHAYCYSPAQTVTVDVYMSDIAELIRGGQFFLSYDTTKLGFVSAVPGDPPFTREIYEAHPGDDGAGTIDYAVGIPDGDPNNPPTADDTVMARITFTALAEVCFAADLVTFRSHQPSTRLSGEFGNEVLPLTLDLPAITIDGQVPVISGLTVTGGDVDDNCEKTVTFSATATDNCCVAASDVSVAVTLPGGNATLSNIVVNKVQNGPTQVDISGSALVSDLTSCPATVCVTIDADDCCNDPATQLQDTADVNDATDPAITCPANISVNADAGSCEADLDPGMATASDNCDPAPAITWLRSDGKPNLTDPYDSADSPITIIWRATDDCGNYTECPQTITVGAYNELLVDVELSPTVVTPLTRCITFELWDCGPDTSQIVEQAITFTNGSAANVLVLVPCGPYDCITARDRLHTLRSTRTTGDGDANPLRIDGTQYKVSFTGARRDEPVPGTGHRLVGGDLNDDGWIDILDFGVFTWQYGTDYGTGDTDCNTPYPHGDINGDGIVDTLDFTFIQINFLLGDEANCCGAPGPTGGLRTSISLDELEKLGLSELAVGDLNHDGWLDQADVEAFMQGARPKTPSQSPDDGPGAVTPRSVRPRP
jgi:hypothetical protein